MTVTTVGVICDVSMPDDSEFSASRLDFTLSGPDYDAASNDAIPAATVSLTLDGDMGGIQPFQSVPLEYHRQGLACWRSAA